MNLEINERHAEMVSRLAKPGAEIVKELTPTAAHLWHMATGVAGEAGELLDAIKKHAIYGKALDFANVEEELGDLEFYMSGIRQALNLSRAKILEANIEKLQTRYGKSYTNKAAIERADKK